MNMTHFARVVIYLAWSIVWWIAFFTWTLAPPYYIDGHYVPVMQFPPLWPAVAVTIVLLFRVYLAHRIWVFDTRVLGLSTGADFVEVVTLSSFAMNQIEPFGFSLSISLYLVLGLMATISVFISVFPRTQHLYYITRESLSKEPPTSGEPGLLLGVFLLAINGVIALLASVLVATSQWPFVTVWTFPVLPWAVILVILFVSNSLAAIGIAQKYNWSYHFAMFVATISIIWGYYAIPTSILIILILMTNSFRGEFLSLKDDSREGSH